MADLWRRRVLVTRPRVRAASWVDGFASRGADVILFPVMELGLPGAAARDEIERTLTEAAKSPDPWIAFTSVTGVVHTLSVLESQGIPLATEFSIAAVGPMTESALQSRGFQVDLVADSASGVELARAIASSSPAAVIVHPTSSVGLGDVQKAGESAGCTVLPIVVTENRPDPDLDPSILKRALDDGGIDLATFASPSAAKALIEIVDATIAPTILSIPALAVGPTTEAALRELGFERVHTAATPGIESVLGCAVEALTT